MHNAGMYVLVFMGILKKMSKEGNIEGMSYIVPIIANVQVYLPKLWKYIKERKPEI